MEIFLVVKLFGATFEEFDRLAKLGIRVCKDHHVISTPIMSELPVDDNAIDNLIAAAADHECPIFVSEFNGCVRPYEVLDLVVTANQVIEYYLGLLSTKSN